MKTYNDKFESIERFMMAFTQTHPTPTFDPQLQPPSTDQQTEDEDLDD